MWLFIIITIATGSATNDNSHDFQKRDTQTSELGVFDSFNKFKTDMMTFFKINYDRIERRRKKIKAAFLQFIEAAFKSDGKNPKCAPTSNQFSMASDQESTDDDVKNNMDDLVKMHGYAVESHEIITTDGYILTLHKILSSNGTRNTFKTQAFLLHHGLFGSAEDWVLLGPKKALPYILLNNDNDVWLTNARGCKYSREHNNPSISDDDFWNFSWHEMGQYDLPAVIDYIKSHYENNVDLHFVGHSMGTTALLVLMSIYPRYNHVLKSAVLLAPMAYMSKIKGPLRLIAEFYANNEYLRRYESLDFLKPHKSASLDVLPWDVVTKYCRGDKILCVNPLLLIANGGQEITNGILKEAIQFHSPAGISVKTLIHYIQLVKSGNFQMYDLGSTKNLKKYGTEYPAIYRLNDVRLPVVVFSSTDDWLATPADIQSLLPNMQNVVMHHVVRRNDFSHTDFVWAEDADVLIYYLILDVIKDIKSKSKYYG